MPAQLQGVVVRRHQIEKPTPGQHFSQADFVVSPTNLLPLHSQRNLHKSQAARFA
jgi:hypothetical protein